MYGTLTIAVRRFYEHLVDAAERMTNDPTADAYSYAAAISLAGTACEVLAGTAIRTIIDEKQLGPVAEAAVAWIREFNLRTEQVQQTWNAIAGDAIQQQPFWPDFIAHVNRRNEVVHTGMVNGQAVMQADAKASLAAARQLIDHVKGRLRAIGLGAYA